ncbi:MAG: nuclear transport factor 2 family protein [Polyangiaceae bacterium]
MPPSRPPTSNPRSSLRLAATLAGALALASTSVASTGCSKNYIPNTDVPDSKENRKLIAFCETYRKAVQRKDVAKILELISPDYYEDGGNLDAADDLDYAGVKDYLEDRFQDASGIRYEIRYRRILKERDHILIDYTFTSSWRIPIGAGEEWQRKVDDNRLEIVPSGDGYLIISGL